MSTIKSDTADLTLNADGSSSALKLQIDGTEKASLTAAGNLTATTFTGAVTGNVTGDVTGAVTGNVTGDVTGDVTGNLTGDISTLLITETETTKTASFTPSFTTDGTIFDVSGTITITMPAPTAGKSFTIIDSGSGTLSWAGTIKWNGGAAPSPSGITIYSFISNGTNWYGMQAGTGFA
jgi:hypothetical protein